MGDDLKIGSRRRSSGGEIGAGLAAIRRQDAVPPAQAGDDCRRQVAQSCRGGPTRSEQDRDTDMVGQPVADPRQIAHDGDAGVAQHGSRADARGHQDARAFQGPQRQDDLATRPCDLQPSVAHIRHALRTIGRQQQMADVGAGDHAQSGMVEHGAEIGMKGRKAPPGLLQDGEVAASRRIRPIQQPHFCQAGLATGLQEGLREGRTVGGRRKGDHAFGRPVAPEGPGAGGGKFGARPALRTQSGPVVEIRVERRLGDHGVDRRASAEHMPHRQGDAAAVQGRLRHGHERPAMPPAAEPHAGQRRLQPPIGCRAAGVDQRDAGVGPFQEAPGQDASRRAAPGDDIVEGVISCRHGRPCASAAGRFRR